jgi:hypothetical protein
MTATNKPRLLTREQFRAAVFGRDRDRCVVCAEAAVDAHHILERRLWPDGGYYLDNGASLCAVCHIKAETTEISCETLRTKAKIADALLPPDLSPSDRYDKWGNPYVERDSLGRRFRGPLYATEQCARILRGYGDPSVFVEWVKYPRTLHLPWSLGASDDDRIMTPADASALLHHEVVVTAKMDGENTTMYASHIHARSTESSGGLDRDWVKGLWASIRHDIPEGYRLCGENLYARHSIGYSGLPSYFLLFSVWRENECLSWPETVEWAGLLGLATVPTLYTGVYSAPGGPLGQAPGAFHDAMLGRLRALKTPTPDGGEHEGYVVRPTASFSRADFGSCVAKCVRAGHVTTTQHWRHTELRPNKLAP